MSIKIIQWVWNHSESKGNERLVLLAIADNANSDGSGAYPSMTELCRKTGGLSERAIRDCLRRLEARGELRVEQTNKGGRGGRANVYSVICDPESTEVNVAPAEFAAAESAGAEKSAGANVEICRCNQDPHLLSCFINRPSNQMPPSSAKPGRKDANPATDSLVKAWWESRNPRPAQPYIAVAKVVDRVLNAGHSPDAVRKALDSVPTVSTGTMEFALNKSNGNSRNGARPPEPDPHWKRPAVTTVREIDLKEYFAKQREAQNGHR